MIRIVSLNILQHVAVRRLLCVVGLLCLVMNAAAAEDAPLSQSTYRFGVVPQQTASKMARLWVPVFNLVERKTGIRIVFETASSIPEFERRLAQGRYDFAYMNPYHYTVFNNLPGYRAFAKQKGKKIQGILVVPKSSRAKSPADLAGGSLAFPAPAAFAASVLPRAYLAKEGIAIQTQYVSSHDSVYHAVAKNLFAGGGGIERTFRAMPKGVRDNLRILWRSKPFTPHAFAAHPRVPKDVVTLLAEALISLYGTSEGANVLGGLQFGQGITLADDAEWDDIRVLGLDFLEHLISGS